MDNKTKRAIVDKTMGIIALIAITLIVSLLASINFYKNLDTCTWAAANLTVGDYNVSALQILQSKQTYETVCNQTYVSTQQADMLAPTMMVWLTLFLVVDTCIWAFKNSKPKEPELPKEVVTNGI